MESATSRSAARGHRVRPFRASDREGFLDLYEAVWGERKSEAWFEWRFEETPFADEVEMVVAEEPVGPAGQSAGAGSPVTEMGSPVTETGSPVTGSSTGSRRLIGAAPLLRFPLRIGEVEVDALQPADWMVHPDCRREGVFTRMTEVLLERYADEAALCFNFPNDQLLPGLRQFDWHVVGDQPTYYRIQRPAAAVSDDRSGASGAALRAGVRTYGSLVRASNRALDRLGSVPDGVEVERYESPPAGPIAGLYEAAPPERVHVSRTAAYVEWRFANPRWDVTTYVARRRGTPVASLVAADRPGNLGLTTVLDVQPMVDPDDEREPAFRALLDAALDDAADSSLVTAPARCYPSTLRRRGFARDDVPPLSWGASVTTLAVRTLGDGIGGAFGEPVGDRSGNADGVSIGGWDLTDPDSWLLAPADQDVA